MLKLKDVKPKVIGLGTYMWPSRQRKLASSVDHWGFIVSKRWVWAIGSEGRAKRISK